MPSYLVNLPRAARRAASLGGAFAARSDDTAALFGGPAGLAFQGGFRFTTDIVFGIGAGFIF